MIITDIIIENETESTITINKESWLKIKKEFFKKNKTFSKENLQKYCGSINLSKDPLEYQIEIRNEW